MTNPAPTNLSNCDREPIHIPAAIQPHGFLLVVDEARPTAITHYSANMPAFLQRAIVDRADSLADVLGVHVAHEALNAAARSSPASMLAVAPNVRPKGCDQSFDLAAHRYGGRIFLEFEPAQMNANAVELLDMSRAIIARVSYPMKLETIAETAVRAVRAALGYDSVMVYRFLHNDSGQVIAENKRYDRPSFRRQHFPASDIPAQARRLYLQNWIRQIVDVNYKPAGLIATDPGPQDGPVDMSFSQLRSVSPIHCEYLQNMGVSASMSLSIVVEGRLWGLLACHHDSPRYIPLPMRLVAEMFAQYFSLQISAAERRMQASATAAARRQLETMTATLDRDASIETTLRNSLQTLSSLAPCDGAGLWMNDGWSAVGHTPALKAVKKLVERITGEGRADIWSTHEIGAVHPDLAPDFGTTTGVMAAALPLAQPGILFLFRNEHAHDVVWAGAPEKIAAHGPSGPRLTPRGSFEAWREQVRGQSRQWTDAEHAIAEAIRNYLRDVAAFYSDAQAGREAQRYKMGRLVNAELNHRVKNIFTLVKSIAAQTGATAASVLEYSESLEGRLRALALAHDQTLAGGAGGAIQTVLLAESRLHRTATYPDRFTFSGPVVHLDERAFGLVALLLHEMMTNAAKYGALSLPDGKVRVTCTRLETGDCAIEWEERDGPPVLTPDRTGFGTTLVRNAIVYELNGAVSIDYASAGVVARFVIPRRFVTETSETALIEAGPAIDETPLRAKRVLVVEDQLLIAMDTEDLLRKLGATSVFAVANVDGALAALDPLPDVAVLDVNLGSENSFAVADALAERGAPFLFATGYNESFVLPERFSQTPVAHKPLTAEELGRIFTDLFKSVGAAPPA